MHTIWSILVFLFWAFLALLLISAIIIGLKSGLSAFVKAIESFIKDPIGTIKLVLKNSLWFSSVVVIGAMYLLVFYIGSVCVFGAAIMFILTLGFGLEPDGPYEPALWAMGISLPFAWLVFFNAHKVLRRVLPQFIIKAWDKLER
jgi:hypothetical protein